MSRTGKERYLIEDAIDRVIKDFEARGYTLTREFLIGKHRIDLVAKKGSEEMLFEFKMPTDDDKAVIQQIHEYTRASPNRRFRLVLVTPPKDRLIDIIGLDDALLGHLIENDSGDLDTLSTHTRIEEVADVDIASFTWDKDGARVQGTASVTVSLQYGSDRESESDPEILDSYPLTFDVTLDSERAIEEVHEINIDTSSFSE